MTPNKEDYLKCIYEIGTEVDKISNKEIASRMQVSPPAVSEMIKRMISEGLLVKDKTHGYLLTDLGSQLVSDLYRKHRLIEVFLLEKLDYTTEEVHEEAEVLEHTVSEHFIDQLDHMLELLRPALTVGQFQRKAKGLSKPTKTVSAKRPNLVCIFCKGSMTPMNC